MQLLRVLLLILSCLASGARAEMTLTPLRQVLTEREPVATYRVSNPSARIIEGRVSWIDLAATETGYQRANDAQRKIISAAPFLTVWPAYFRLEPGASTTVSVAIKDPKRLGSGERRSHLVIETAAVRTPLRRAGGSLELDIGLGVSTPVILRAGPGDATARFGATRLLRAKDGSLEIETHVEADGVFSAYGRVDILFRPAQHPEGEAPRLLKRLENIAAYTDAPRRRVVAQLEVGQLPHGILELHYIGRAEFEGVEFARKSFEIMPPR